MFSDKLHQHPSGSFIPESTLRFGMKLAKLWCDWFETMSQVAYQTHRTCEFFVQNGGPSNEHYGAFDSRSRRNSPPGPNDSIDMEKLKRCLQSMDSIQAARVIYAVQTMQVVEAMMKRQGSRASEVEEDAW